MYTKNIYSEGVWIDALKPAPMDLTARLENRRRPRPGLPDPYVAPSGEIQIKIASFWKEILGYTEIGLKDNLFSLGGDSLQITRIAARIQEGFKIELSFGDFFSHPSIESLAELIARRTSDGSCSNI